MYHVQNVIKLSCLVLSFPGLITSNKWLQPTANVKIGDLVLVDNYAVPRGYWPLGRIMKVFPGHDNIALSSEVKTKFERPVAKLTLLEECSPSKIGQTRGRMLVFYL